MRMIGSYKLTSSSHVSHCPPSTFCLAIMTVNATVDDDKTYIHLRVRPYIHICPSYAWPVRWCDMRGRRNRFVRFWASAGASGGEKFPKMGDSLPRTPMNHDQNLTPLALSSPEKSVTVQTQITNRQIDKQTNKNSKIYIHTLLIGMCG